MSRCPKRTPVRASSPGISTSPAVVAPPARCAASAGHQSSVIDPSLHAGTVPKTDCNLQSDQLPTAQVEATEVTQLPTVDYLSGVQSKSVINFDELLNLGYYSLHIVTNG
jgi:hypothetical protein